MTIYLFFLPLIQLRTVRDCWPDNLAPEDTIDRSIDRGGLNIYFGSKGQMQGKKIVRTTVIRTYVGKMSFASGDGQWS